MYKSIAIRVWGRLATFIVAALLGGFLAPGASLAQSNPAQMSFDVPFAFEVAGQQLPAGHYSVSMQTDSVIRLTPERGENTFTLTHSVSERGDGRSKLVFHRYGDTYFLASVCLSSGGSLHALYPTRAEQKLQDRKAEMELAIVRSPM